ncbi:MAG: metalloregulator ArsR/SmtB family transcription factor [Elusimicrobia bacterium]|nr:metalloregulator ArsR/SmtB family transcription factor [Elusimicrobiota bacterium]
MKPPRHAEAGRLARTLRHIAHPLRLLIVCMLSSGEKCAGDISGPLGTTRGNVSQHLRILTDNGVLSRRKEGNKVFYGVRDGKMSELVAMMRRLYCPGRKAAEGRP